MGKKEYIRSVDHHGHAVLAVPALGAVQPEGSGVVDLDGVGGDHAHRRRGGHRLETRVEASSVAVHGHGLAGLVEGGLGHGVVAGEELELHELAGRGLDIAGGEGEGAVLGDGDDPGFLSCFLAC